MKTKKILIAQMAEQDRPREKCERLGVDKLSDEELLALLLRTGTRNLSAVGLAGEILSMDIPGAGLEKLYHLSRKDLLAIRGIGKVKTSQIMAISELSIRLSKIEFRDRLSYSSPDAIARYYMTEFRAYRQEHLMMMLFDSKNHLIGERMVSKGTVNASMAEPREIFVEALRMDAVYIVLVHNHPSGDTTPSSADLAVTRRIFEAGSLIGIQLLDHIIVAGSQYRSLKAEGYIPLQRE
ncbi:MAG: JAB domain-containing protein [Clostridia bacterium]|nr:DNA repair protein RadC [Lachnospiraceae bacterium]NCC00652.1 JAB domain-containing protein [Clostridia bacterium]NCD02664.1 JAB domain-containing protein [Clostridia bacterium]